MLKIYHVLLLAVIINRYSGTVAQYDRPQAALPGEYYEEEDEDDYMPVSPCNVVRPGDPDLTTYDVISSYRFDEYHYKFEGVQQIAGSTGYQTAYHIEDYSNTTIESIQAFPRGVPNEFSFECTFRVPDRQPPNEWYLFELTDYKYESQMSVTINPIINSIDFSLPKYDGSLQTVSFEEIEIFDRSWHKVMFGVTNDAVRLWVDCKPVPDRSGNLQAPLDVRSPIDSTEGAFSVARDCQTRTTVPIDLQWMIFSCDAEKPKRTDCREIQYAVAPKELTRPDPKFQFPYRPENRPLPPQYEEETTFPPPDFSFATTSTRRPWFISTTPAALQQPEESTCPEQCPRGPPGPPGPPGLQGYPGPAGPPATSYGQYDNRLQKGERGEVGLSGLPGRDGMKGEPGRDGMPGRDGIDGAPGPQGAPGIITGQDFSTLTVAGEKGSMGLKGDKGDNGVTGLPGYPGISGMPGAKGSSGVPGEMGLPGRPGEPGPSGEKGDMGAPGLPGIMGYPGTQGLTGPEGPPGPPGPTGNSGTIYSESRTIEERQIREICMEVVRDYISEISATLTGPPGPPGRRGVGRPGAPGAAGLQGEPGQSGPQGERGYPGIPGMPGANGERGSRGAEGEKGNRGEDGIGREGPMGPPGPPGPEGRGIDGMPGRQGDRGDTGRPGEPGARGTPGQPGVCPDCTAYNAAYAYPLLLAQQQQSNKGPQNYYNKGPQNYNNKGP